MRDERLVMLAKRLVEDSVSLKAGEHLLIRATSEEQPLVVELVRAAYRVGGYPHLDISIPTLRKELLLGLSEASAETEADYEKTRIAKMDAMISVGTTENPMELSEAPAEHLAIRAKADQRANAKVREGRVKWCVAIYPTPFYAYCAGMSLSQFEDYYFRVCTLDYRRLREAMLALQRRMRRTDRVRIVRPGTDLSFSIKDIPVEVSAGERNIPDGEVYTAPVLDSVEGTIAFNIPSNQQGVRFEQVTLRFEHGRVAQADANHAARLGKILDTDEGARRVGEFAFGLNPELTKPIGLTLFDEKIWGSIHLALGHALDLTDNGNRSAIHWDMVAILTREHGGGEVWFDGELVQKDGLFVPGELQPLNYTNAEGCKPE